MKQQLHVLMVEDSEDDAVLLKRQLERGGFEVHSERVETAASFVSELESKAWDIILCDFRMPKFNGLSALTIVKERTLDIPFIFVSGTMGEETAVEAMKAGAHDYVMKGNLRRLIPAIERELGEAKVRSARTRAESALQASERRLFSIYNAVADPIYLLSIEKGEVYRFVSVNDAFCRTTGLREEMIVGKLVNDVVPASSLPNVLMKYREAVETRSIVRWEETSDYPAGRLTGEVSVTPIISHNGPTTHLVGSVHDITERRKAEKQIELLAHTLRSVGECVSITDVNDTILFVNDAFLSTYGYAENEILGENISVIQSPKNSPDLVSEIYRLARDKGWRGELINRTKDGREIPIELSTSIVRDNAGRAVALVGVASDITKRKQAEETRRLLTTALESAANGVTITDLEGRIVWVNKSFRAMTGYTWSELMGQNPKILKSGIQQDAFYQDLWKTINSGNVWHGELVNRKKDGNAYIDEMTITPMKSPTGTITHFIAIKQDITERRKAEEKSSRLAAIVEFSQDAIIGKTLDGIITSWNLGAEKIYGFTESEMLGKSISLLLPPGNKDDMESNLDLLTLGKSIEQYETVRRRKDGGEIQVSVSISPVRDIHGTIIGGSSIARDITEFRKLETNLVSAAELAKLGYWEYNVDSGNFIFNDQYYRLIHGSTAEKQGGYTLSGEEFAKRLVHPDDAYLVGHALQEAIASRDPYYFGRQEARVFREDGSIATVSVMFKAVKDIAGRTYKIYGANQDITERKQADEAIRYERNLLRAVLDNTPDHIYFKDEKSRFLRVSRAQANHFGLESSDAALGKTDFDFFSEEHAQSAFNAELKIMETGVPLVSTEERETWPDGRETWVSTTKVPLKNADGEIIGTFGISRDITEQKQVEEALRESKERLSLALLSTDTGVWEWNAVTNEVFWSPECYDIVGMDLNTKKTFEGFMRQVHPDDTVAFNAAVQKSLKDKSQFEAEFRIINAKGELIWLYNRGKGEFESNGRPKRMVGTVQNISNRKQAEFDLKQSEEKYRSIFEESKDAIVITSADATMLDINPAGVELLGYGSKEEILKLQIDRDIFADPQRSREFRSLINTAGYVKNFEAVLKCKDGRRVQIIETASAIRDKEGKIIGSRGIVRDVTSQRQLEQELIQAQKMESIGTLASGIAHDFNNILGIILGYTSIIERTMERSELLDQSLQTMKDAVARGAALVKQILTFARKTEVTIGPIDPNVMIKGLSNMLRETFPKSIEIATRLCPGRPLILADATELHQAILNLCVNARDAMPKHGSLTISTLLINGSTLRDVFPEVTDQNYLRVSVADTGVGIDEETMRRIFDPFFTTKEKGRGTGLGLSVVYGVMKNHHGYVNVESQPGKGTTFNLYFPLTDQPAQITKESPEEWENIRGGNEKILFVEDEATMQEVVKKLLEMKGYRVISAYDGKEALEIYLAQRSTIALVLSDIGLPRMTGTELYYELKRIDPKIPVLLASGYIEPNMKSEILKAGVIEFIQKPYAPSEVLLKIRRTLDEHHAAQ